MVFSVQATICKPLSCKNKQVLSDYANNQTLIGEDLYKAILSKLPSPLFEKSLAVGFELGLASDVGGGTSFSPFHTMMAAYYVGREGHTKNGLSLSPSQLWYLHTAGAAKALDIADQVGNLRPGQEADFIILNPSKKPILERRISKANSFEEVLFAYIVLADDRVIDQTFIAGA